MQTVNVQRNGKPVATARINPESGEPEIWTVDGGWFRTTEGGMNSWVAALKGDAKVEVSSCYCVWCSTGNIQPHGSSGICSFHLHRELEAIRSAVQEASS